MKSIRASFAVLLLLLSIGASGKEVEDTLFSSKNDQIIVTYSIVQKNNKVELQFKSVRKVLCDEYRNKYGTETKEIQTLFFDWIGTREDMKFTGATPSAIRLPAKASYKRSSDGYFFVEQRPLLTFELGDSEARTVYIPLYLAHYEAAHHYKILCSCGELKINVSPTAASSQLAKPEKPSQMQQIEFETIEEEEFSEYNDQALNLINSINKELQSQTELPMNKTLEKKMENLVGIQSKISDEDIFRKIDATLEAYNNKQKELEKAAAIRNEQAADDNAFACCTTKEGYELYVKQHPNGRHVEEAKEKIGELEAKAKEEEAGKKKRTIWMIVGGVLLAILLFVGNQVLQSVRNRRSQRNIMKMQQDATKRAQSMARNKAQREIRKQTNKVTGQVRQKGKNFIRDAANKAKNNQGNNRLSI